LEESESTHVCPFCRSSAGREEIFMGKTSYGYKCLTCGAIAQHSAKKIREQGYLAAGEQSSPWSIVSDLLRDPYYLITGKRPKKKPEE
jgi:transposase-like protein